MKKSNFFLTDGTFKIAPMNFHQLFVIHVMYFDKRLPMVYALTKTKTLETYRQIFSILKEKEKINIPHLICDFEIGIVNAFMSIYPKSKVYGCIFHFGQIIWRQVQKFGQVIDYREDREYRNFIQKILLLSYVPTDFINHLFNIINGKYKDEKYQKIKIFFYESFILNTKNNKNKELKFWNVYERIIYNIPTSTCSLEAWHRHLNAKIGKYKPNIAKVVDILKSEERKTKIIAENLKYGMIRSNKRENNHIITILKNFKHYQPEEYLNILSENIKFHLN